VAFINIKTLEITEIISLSGSFVASMKELITYFTAYFKEINSAQEVSQKVSSNTYLSSQHEEQISSLYLPKHQSQVYLMWNYLWNHQRFDLVYFKMDFKSKEDAVLVSLQITEQEISFGCS